MIKCIKCDMTLPNDAKFCKECGTKQIKVCPSCKTPIEDWNGNPFLDKTLLNIDFA